MTWYSSRRAAACGGALAITIAMGAIVAPAADAAVGDLGGTAGAVGSAVSGTGTAAATTVAVVTGTGGSTAQAPAASTTTVGSTVTTATQSTNGAVSTTTGTVSNGTTTVGTALDGTAGTSAGSTVGGTASQVLDQTGGLVSGAVTTGGGGASNGGAVEVVVGSNGQGGSLADVSLGSVAQDLPVVTTPVVSAPAVTTPSVPTPATSDGVPGTVSTGSTPASGTTTGSPAKGAARLLGLGIGRSVPVVYPVKDGYRDDVVFTLDGVTASGGTEALDGTAVLRRGRTVVKRWTVSRSDQQLRWDGRSGSRIVTGAYTLTTGATDAAGHAYSATSGVTVSGKRLVASTAKVSAPATSGRHRMIAAPRAGLSRGDVTLRVTTVATKVRGGVQKLIFEKNGKQLVVPITKGTHTSKPITIPKAFTDFTLKHTWKKGQVVLKAVRYTYSYQSLK